MEDQNTQPIQIVQPKITDLSGASDLPAASGGNAPQNLISVEQSRAIQEVQAALIIAKKFPRDEISSIGRIMNECQRPSLAKVATYSYSKGGAEITGPSIRLAEVLKRHWGNIQTGFRILEQSGNSSTVQAYAWDQETNVKEEKTFVVKHIRNTKRGSYPITDEREVYELIANQAMRRVRACILSIVPGDIAEMAVEQCEKTLKVNADVTPERLKAMVETFQGYGVSKEALEKRVQRNIDTISPAQFISLGKIANSLRDGMSKPQDWFEMSTTAPAQQQGQEPQSKIEAIKEAGKKAKEKIEDQKPQESDMPLNLMP